MSGPSLPTVLLAALAISAAALPRTTQAACRDPVVPGGDWIDAKGDLVHATEGGILRVGST